MHIITRKRLNDFAEKHPDALCALAHWYQLMKRGQFRGFTHLRETISAKRQRRARRANNARLTSQNHMKNWYSL